MLAGNSVTTRETGPIVVFARQLPHPPRGGGDLRTWHLIRGLAERGEVSVFGHDSLLTPRPAGVRHWEVGSGPPPPTERLRAGVFAGLGERPNAHPTDLLFTESLAEQICDFVRTVDPGLVVVDGVDLHRFIEVLRPLAPRLILNTHNIEGQLHADLIGARTDPLSRLLARRWLELEAAAFGAVDQVWVCSDREVALARSLYPGSASVVAVPNVVDVGAEGPAADGREPAELVYPASFAYPPNVRAAERLLERVFPAVAAAIPDARLVLAGMRPTQVMLDTAERDDRVVVTGAVDEMGPWLRRATVMPIPLVEGGGTRLKALEAFAAGLPVVSTAKGVEGLDVRAGEHYIAAETDEAFARELIDLIRSPDRYRALTARAHRLVRERYAPPAAATCVASALDALGLRPSEAVNRKSLT